MAVVLKPPSTYMISPLMPDARSEHRKRAGVADFFDGDVATQRGLRFVGGQHLAEVLDAGSGEGADRAGRYAVDASTVRAQGAGQVTYAGFQEALAMPITL